MSRFTQHFRLFVLGVCCLLALEGSAFAGWFGFQNDTNQTLVVQENLSSGSMVRLGKPQKLFTNEAFRDNSTATGQRRFSIYDAAKPDKLLYSGTFNSPAAHENLMYVIKPDGKGGLVIEIQKSVSIPKK